MGTPTATGRRGLPTLRRRPPSAGHAAAALLLAALGALVLPRGAAAQAGAGSPRPDQERPATITVSYADLIDGDAVTRTGRRLGEAVRDARTPRDQLQPFLDGYSSLLPYVVEMVFGAEPAPRRDIVERWPPGSAQPAWVALFRGGRYRAVADGRGGVSLFLPGDAAASAWKKHYPVVRHCLAALAADGFPLSVKVFAYRNDYRRQELRLDLRPVLVSGASFPPDRASLDLSSLEEFFRKGGRLEGAQLDRDEGLVLYANPDQRETLGGDAVSLADFAVAYRAVFHAGDNDAFISLDPSADPTIVSVNFGGYLEDTRLGAAVLAADRLFKTISTGLDAVTFRDIRADIRRRLPTFLTAAERGFVEGSPSPGGAWLSIRSWFYPETISVDADPVEGFAVITRPQFTAAAERSTTAYGRIDPRKKGAELPPDIRESIRDINRNYARYAAAFTEIGDLSVVARLMAVTIWLQRSEVSWLDLDALLSAELPAVSTPRSLEQIVSAEHVAFLPSERLTEALVRSRSEVTWITPMLRRTVGDFFGNPRAFSAYFCSARKSPGRPCSDAEAEAVFTARRGEPLRALFGSTQDLLSFLEFLSSRIEYPPPSEVRAAQAGEAADRRRSEALGAELAGAEAALAAADASSPEYAAAQERKERVEAEIDAIMKRYHDGAGGAPAWRTKSTIHVNGGISLKPREFTIHTSAGSPALERFKQRAKGAGPQGGPGVAGGALVRSRPARTPPRAAGSGPAVARPEGPGKGAAPETAPSLPPAAARPPGAPPSHPKVPGQPAGPKPPPPSVKPQAEPPPAAAAAEKPIAPVSQRVSVPPSAAGTAGAVGELRADGRIVFRKAR